MSEFLKPEKIETSEANQLLSFMQEAAQIDDARSLLWYLQAQRPLTADEQERLNQLDDLSRELLARVQASGFGI